MTLNREKKNTIIILTIFTILALAFGSEFKEAMESYDLMALLMGTVKLSKFHTFLCAATAVFGGAAAITAFYLKRLFDID